MAGMAMGGQIVDPSMLVETIDIPDHAVGLGIFDGKI
jgi:hypothetical protein